MTKRAKIAIVGGLIAESTFGIGRAYIEWLRNYGDPIVLGPSDTIHADIDLLVLPGGQDTFSLNYKQVPSCFNTNPDVMKEFFFKNNLPYYIEAGIPVFGVCLGIQMLNVHFGGGITQNCYHPYSEKERSDIAHTLDFTPKYASWKKKFAPDDKKGFGVNSLHHQGIELKSDLSEEFEAIATGPYGIVEAMIHKELPIAGVQWHPEEIWDAVADKLITDLLHNERTITRLARADGKHEAAQA